ncbi:MAG: hypothetical protein IH874_01245 [Candidatus Dadabacteria bacterium]|nr:hypothetical protein [Candidatus Dadabacteria bacterium]
MKYLIQKPLVPLAEISRTLVIPESTLRDWIRKGKIVVESAARSYRKSAMNMVDLNSLSNELDRDTEELAAELTSRDVKIFIRTLTKSETENITGAAQYEAMEPEGLYESAGQLHREIHMLFSELKQYKPDIGKIEEVNIDNLSEYLHIKPEKLLFELEKERQRRKNFIDKLLPGIDS